MTKRDVIQMVLEARRPPYVPWSFSLTQEAKVKLAAHLGPGDLEEQVGNHLLKLGLNGGPFDDLGNFRVRDAFGVVWDRSVDRDIGVVTKYLLPEPTLRDYEFPKPRDPRFFADISAQIAQHGDRYRLFRVGFSLYERAWTLRGMESLMKDFHKHPEFVRELLNAIADYNIGQVREALKYDIDAVYFGDDWGQQHGLQMSPRTWREFILPVLQRMYGFVRGAGKTVFIHSCGDVDELFDDLIAAGVNCFNPFQPEVMDVFALLRQYHGRLTFHGGLSTQQTLPYGSVEDVKAATRRLLEAGADGGYIFAPAHAVEGDVPLENMLAFLEVLKAQPGAELPRAADRGA
jgi:uroporphyrinogen decarboxylase